jgi:hypothetical protein
MAWSRGHQIHGLQTVRESKPFGKLNFDRSWLDCALSSFRNQLPEVSSIACRDIAEMDDGIPCGCGTTSRAICARSTIGNCSSVGLVAKAKPLRGYDIDRA